MKLPDWLRHLLPNPNNLWEWSLLLIVLGSRLTVYAYAGSPLPYYDQWLAEFSNVFIGISTGQNYAALFDRHNEHLLVTTKLLSLLGYACNGYWDVTFLVICSALVRAVTVTWLLHSISELVHPRSKGLLWLLCVGLFAVPFSGYNFLCGMQVSFYFVDLALLWSLHTLTHWTTPLKSGASLVAATLFGLVSMGSAITYPAAIIGVHFCQKRPRPGFWLAWSLTALLAAAYIFRTITTKAAPAAEHAVAFFKTFNFWLQLLAWPIDSRIIGAGIVSGCALVAWFSLKPRKNHSSAQAILVGVGIYAAANAALIALNRTPESLHMRHWDMLGLCTLVVISAGLHCAENPKFRPYLLLLTAAFALGYCYKGAELFVTISQPYMQEAHIHRAATVDHYKTLLLEQDLKKEAGRINTLLGQQDYHFFDDTVDRYALHPIVLTNLINFHRTPLAMLSPEIIPLRAPSLLSEVSQKVITYSWLLSAAGILMGSMAFRRLAPRVRSDC